jgi:hypothetical protein
METEQPPTIDLAGQLPNEDPTKDLEVMFDGDMDLVQDSVTLDDSMDAEQPPTNSVQDIDTLDDTIDVEQLPTVDLEVMVDGDPDSVGVDTSSSSPPPTSVNVDMSFSIA